MPKVDWSALLISVTLSAGIMAIALAIGITTSKFPLGL